MIGIGGTGMDGDAMDAQAAAQVAELADGVGRMISVARALAEGGRQVELDGLDRHIGLLCAKVLDLPPGLARSQRIRLLTLRTELDGLSAVVRQDDASSGDPWPSARA